MKRILVAIFALLMLTSCGGDDLQGDVVGKTVDPGYDYIYMMPMTSTRCSGNPVVCTTYTSGYIPVTIKHGHV